MNTFLFSVSIVFQFSGAVLLVINNFCNTKRKIGMEYFPSQGKTKFVDGRLMIDDKDRLSEILGEIYMNRISFFYIALGYIAAVVGDNGSSKKCVLTVFLIVISIFTVKLTQILASKYAKYSSEKSKYLFLDTDDLHDGTFVVGDDDRK